MRNIVIGTRRQIGNRGLRGAAIAGLIVCTAVLVGYVIHGRLVRYAQPSPKVPERALEVIEDTPAGTSALGFESSTLSYAGSLPVLRLHGRPETIGAATGRLLAETVELVNASLQTSVDQSVHDDGWTDELFHRLRLRWRYRLLDEGIPGHQLMEMAALLAAAQKSTGRAPSYEGFVRTQAVLDVGVPAPSSAGLALRAMARSLSFVTTLRGPSGDRLLLGRTFAVPGADDDGAALAQQRQVRIVHADGVIPFASVDWPGMIGVVTGINAEGIAIMLHPGRTTTVRVARPAQPLALLVRDVLENARSLDEAIAVFENAKPLGSGVIALVDGNARAWARVEISPTQTVVSRSPNRPVLTGILRSDNFADDPENDRALRTRPASRRAQRAIELLRKKNPTTTAEAIAILRDPLGTAGLPLPLGHPDQILDIQAAHSVLIDASGMVLWLSDGPGACGRFRAFDLRHELRNEGARPAPPTDVPSDPECDGSAIDAVFAAQRDTRRARIANRAGSRAQARELIRRALNRAPALPGTLRLAGDLARSAGDREAARAYYQRFLAIGPSDSPEKDEIRALLAIY